MSAVYTQQPLFVLSKVCTKCNDDKPLEDFELAFDGLYGRRATCKKCRNKQRRERENNRPPKPKPTPIIPKQKFCPGCEETLSSAYFGFNKSTKDGLQSYCKLCRKAYRQENIDKINQKGRQCYHNNKDKHCQERKQYYQEHKEEIKLKNRQYRLAHPEKVKDRKQREYQNNKESIIERNARYQRENKEAVNARGRKYAKTPKGKLVSKASGHKRRALKRESAIVDTVDYAAILERDGYWCYICNKDIDPTISGNKKAGLTFDHEKPLAGVGERKGTHDASNIHPAHRLCNCRKGVKLLCELTPFQRSGL